MADAVTPLTVRDVMRAPAPTVGMSDSVATVARVMVEHRVPGVPVLDGERLVGIVTEADVVARQADVSLPAVTPWFDAMLVWDAGQPLDEELRRVLATTAGDLMSSPVYSLRNTATLEEVATFLIDQHVNQAPVVDAQGHVVGLVSRSDLVRIIARLESDALAPGP